MRKQQFLSTMVSDLGLLYEDALQMTDAVSEQIRKQLLKGEEVRLGTIGRFVFRFCPGYTGVNHLTGKTCCVPPRVKIRFALFPQFARDLQARLLAGELDNSGLSRRSRDEDCEEI